MFTINTPHSFNLIHSQGEEDKSTYQSLWGQGFLHGLEAIKFYGGATVGMRTMLDALEPAILALRAGGEEDIQEIQCIVEVITKRVLCFRSRKEKLSEQMSLYPS